MLLNIFLAPEDMKVGQGFLKRAIPWFVGVGKKYSFIIIINDVVKDHFCMSWNGWNSGLQLLLLHAMSWAASLGVLCMSLIHDCLSLQSSSSAKNPKPRPQIKASAMNLLGTTHIITMSTLMAHCM